MKCDKCHNHPFENWSQNQFWGLTAFYSGLEELRDSHVVLDALGGGHVDRTGDAKLLHPKTKEEGVPAFLEGRRLQEKEGMDRRGKLAQWVTASELPASLAPSQPRPDATPAGPAPVPRDVPSHTLPTSYQNTRRARANGPDPLSPARNYDRLAWSK